MNESIASCTLFCSLSLGIVSPSFAATLTGSGMTNDPASIDPTTPITFSATTANPTTPATNPNQNQVNIPGITIPGATTNIPGLPSTSPISIPQTTINPKNPLGTYQSIMGTIGSITSLSNTITNTLDRLKTPTQVVTPSTIQNIIAAANNCSAFGTITCNGANNLPVNPTNGQINTNNNNDSILTALLAANNDPLFSPSATQTQAQRQAVTGSNLINGQITLQQSQALKSVLDANNTTTQAVATAAQLPNVRGNCNSSLCSENTLNQQIALNTNVGTAQLAVLQSQANMLGTTNQQLLTGNYIGQAGLDRQEAQDNQSKLAQKGIVSSQRKVCALQSVTIGFCTN